MNSYIKHFLCTSIFAVFVSLSLFSQIVEIDFMRLPADGSRSEYLEVEKLWKPVHQEYVNRGELLGWYLYEIPYPGGTDAEYHFATVRLYKDMAQAGNQMNNLMATIQKVYANEDIDAYAERTGKSRDLIKTYSFYNWESFFAENTDAPAKYVTMVYFNIPMKKWDAYQDMEKNYYHPAHKAEIKADLRQGWAGLHLRRPMGMSMPFQFVAVDFYKDYAQYIKPTPEGLFKDVMTKEKMAEREELFYKTAELVKLEEWHLIDYVNEDTK